MSFLRILGRWLNTSAFLRRLFGSLGGAILVSLVFLSIPQFLIFCIRFYYLGELTPFQALRIATASAFTGVVVGIYLRILVSRRARRASGADSASSIR